MAEEIRHPFQDNLTRFVFEHAAVRGAVVSLDSTYRDILACHPYPLGLARLLGEALAAVCLLAHALKSQGRLILQLQGTGQLRLLVVECDLSHLEDIRRHWPFLRDRRIDSYDRIVHRLID